MLELNSSLNDAAALLMQLEPNDFSELARLREILDTIAADESCTASSREKIIRAVQKIGEIVDIGASDPEKSEDILHEVGQLIEDAMNAMEEDGDAPTHVGPDQKGKPVSEEGSPDSPSSVSEAGFMPSDADSDLVAAFITESSDLITTAEDALLSLEMDPDDIDSVGTVFRAFHTIKGTSAFLELSLISEMAHRSETFLSRIRDREIRYAGGYTDLALRAVDMLKELIHSVQNLSGGQLFFKPHDYDDLMNVLADPEKAGISEETQEFTPQIDIPAEDVPPESDGEAEQRAEDEEQRAEDEEQRAEDEEQRAEDEEQRAEDEEQREDWGQRAEDVSDISASEDEPPVVEKKPVKLKTVPLTSVDRGLPPKQSEGTKNLVESSVRVPIERLDRFIDMVGELVVAHSMVVQDEIVAGGRHHELLKKVTLTSKIVRELQNMSMSMRMIPLKATFRKMARLVRDVARKAGKNVTFVTEGEDTEIDRNMVDIINDPLVHMVRNAVDHGIELPEVREKQGKTGHGTIKLSARHSAGNVVVEIRDDGKGLSRKAIFEKAVESGIISHDSEIRESMLNDHELFNLIFEPGFSTAKTISDISGRGVGMNVVKTNIEALRGQIEIQSRPGNGSVFKMSLPLTLAIIDGMVVRVGSEKYVMPTISIVRSVQPDPNELSTVLNKGETLMLQGKLIPLFRLAELFQIENAETDPAKAIIMVVEDDGRQAGILIDELIGSQQIVIKTLGEAMRNIPGISGSAIMPNGRVGLILDVGGLVRLANTGR
ncbi:chemotaxis protein CheA [Desulfobacterales bacterium HSG2]|nr:chemotaxis protein CheA [Desulfobacterales bacterium HSG2]